MKQIFFMLYFIFALFVEFFELLKEDFINGYALGVTPVAGLKGTGSVTSARIKIDMDEKMYEYNPNAQALLLLLNKLGKGEAKSFKHEWQEDDYAPLFAVKNGTQAGEGNPVVVSSVPIRVNDIITNPLEAVRNFIVTAIPDATHVTLSPIDGGADANWTDADKLIRVGNASEEGAGARALLSTQPDLLYNLTQIFKTPFGSTNTLKAVDIYGGAELDRDRKKMAVNHTVEIQQAILFGERGTDTSGTHPKRYMNGIANIVTTKVTDQNNNVLTEADFENWLEDGFEYGSDTKYDFSSARGISYISAFGRDKVRVVPKDKTFGINVTEWISPHGKVYLLNFRKTLNYDPWNKSMYLLDLPMIKYVPLKTRDTKLEMNIQDNDADEEKDQFITEATCKITIEEAHSIMEDIG